MSSPSVIEALDEIPRSMARALVQMLPSVQLAGYVRFLDTMFHYTRDSGARLVEAAAITGDPALASFYAELAGDEKSHYRLAEADLASFGSAPSDEPPAPVRDFQVFWATPTPEREHVLLGALFVLEGVAAHLGDEVRPALQRLGLGPSNARFVLVHLQADEAHGAACRAQVLRVADRAPESLLTGARAAGALWIAMHRCLVDDSRIGE
jgi:heme oxygenase